MNAGNRLSSVKTESANAGASFWATCIHSKMGGIDLFSNVKECF